MDKYFFRQDSFIVFKSVKLVAWLILCWVPLFGLAATPSDLKLDNTQLESLSQTNAWWRLLHYKQHFYGVRSQVDAREFFLSPIGYKNPAAELQATVEQLFNILATSVEVEEHLDVRCRFPARINFLERSLNWPLPKRSCPDLDKWLEQIDAGSMSMIFPSAYMNNAASMFGHSFLRIEGAGARATTDLVAHAINFAARVSDNDGAVAYGFKGMFGLYPGYFSLEPYYEKIDEYNNLENRDMWEYPLQLSSQGIKRVVWHMWELEDIYFDYWFFDENCSYQLLALLSVAADDLYLTQGFDLKALPVDTVRALENADLLNDTVKYRPSFATQLLYRVEQVNAQELELAQQLVFDYIDPKTIQSRTEVNLAKVYELAYEWLNFRYRHQNEPRNKAAVQLHKLLQARSQVEVKAGFSAPPVPVAPHKGHATAQFSLGMGRVQHSNYLQLAAKPSYHGRYDSLEGYLPNAEINLLELTLRLDEEKQQLIPWHLNLLEVGNYLQTSPVFSLFAWRVKADVGRTRPKARAADDWRSSLNGGYGRAWGSSASVMGFVLLDMTLEAGPLAGHNKDVSKQKDWAVGLGLAAGLVAEPLPNWRTGIDLTWNSFVAGNQGASVAAEATLQWNYERNQAVRLQASWLERSSKHKQLELAWLKFF